MCMNMNPVQRPVAPPAPAPMPIPELLGTGAAKDAGLKIKSRKQALEAAINAQSQ